MRPLGRPPGPLPHTLAGLFLVGAALAATVQYARVLAFGAECDGRVVGKTATKGGKGGMHYAVEYAFVVNGTERAGRASVNQEGYEGLTEGEPVAVRALEADPAVRPWVRLPGQSPAMDVLGQWGAALFWNGIMSLFVWGAYARPWRARRLVRDGRAVPGVIRDVTTRAGKGGKSYRLTYEYAASDPFGLPGQPRLGTMTTERKEASAYRSGRPVTVVYDPDKPSRSVVYALADYRARGVSAS
jgi:hypothetical protein